MNTKDFETGFEDVDAMKGPILPDRLTQQYEKAVDHPTFFAKGTDINDSTVGGKCVKEVPGDNGVDAASQIDEITDDDYLQPPEGFKAERIANTKTAVPVGRAFEGKLGRVLGDDSEFDFIPREEFGGLKSGFVFRLGSKGIGYYEDKNQQ
jgi:hypothetical protein